MALQKVVGLAHGRFATPHQNVRMGDPDSRRRRRVICIHHLWTQTKKGGRMKIIN